jgi:hypothetical protein
VPGQWEVCILRIPKMHEPLHGHTAYGKDKYNFSERLSAEKTFV